MMRVRCFAYQIRGRLVAGGPVATAVDSSPGVASICLAGIWVASLCLAGFGLAACRDDDARPPIGPGSGPRLPAASGGPTGGSPSADDDAGTPPDDTPFDDATECMVIASGSLDRTLSSPVDFAPRYATATWGADCTDPTLVLSFAEDDCADGTDASGQQLRIEIRADAVDDLLLPGQNPVSDLLLSALRIRYRRPARELPSGTWGTCPGVAGQVEVVRLDPNTTGTITLGLSMELADCTGMFAAPQVLEGDLSVFLQRDRATACPDR